MRKLQNLFIVIVIAFALASCGGDHPDAPTSQAEIEAGQQTRANEESFSSKDVQGKWELIEIQGDGVDFELYKGTTLKFDADAMYKILNDNKEMGIFFIKDFILHWTVNGNEVTYKANIIDGNLQLVNGANQTFIYKRYDTK